MRGAVHFPLCTASMKKSGREMSTSAKLQGKKVRPELTVPLTQSCVSRAGSHQEVEGQLKAGVGLGRGVTVVTWASCTLLDYYKGQCLGRRMECELLARD